MAILVDATSMNTVYSNANNSYTHAGGVLGGKSAAVVTGHRAAGSGGYPPTPGTMTFGGVAMTKVFDPGINEGTNHRNLFGYILLGVPGGNQTVNATTSYANWEFTLISTTFNNVLSYSGDVNTAGATAVSNITG